MSLNLSPESQGELLIFSEAVLWGLFPVITIISYNTLSPLVSLAGSALFATLFFAAVLTVKKKWHELKNPHALPDILLGTFFLGIFYYMLSFIGLHYTSAGNASIIALTEVFFSFLFFHVWRKDELPRQHLIGAFFMAIGAVIILVPTIHAPKIGDLLIFTAAAIAPFGNFFIQRARKKVGSESIMFLRSLISCIFVGVLALALHDSFSVVNLKSSLIFLIINGLLLLGLSKFLWIEGIHRISVTKAVAVNSSITPLITLFFAWIFLKTAPTGWQLLSLIPMFVGVVFLGKKKSSSKTS